MDNKKFILLELEDEKAKRIAKALSNESCKKILDFLAENEATETEISQKLKIPLPTVHYNLKQLLLAKLIIWEKYHYSDKGKEVRHYTVANKYIIITPKGDSQHIREKLKTLFPVFLFVLLFATLIQFFTSKVSTSISYASQDIAQKEVAETVAGDSVRSVAFSDVAPEVISHQQTITDYLLSSYAFWFILGAISSILIFYIVKFIVKKLKI